MAKKQKTSSSTQKYLPFKAIKEGVIVMKDGSLRTVLMVNSINFNLKSQDEQTALLDNYQSFLNALGFPIEIVVQSRVLDLDDYLTHLDKVSRSQNNELLQLQTQEYTNFIKELIGVANIMSKTFYVVIPYSPGLAAAGNFFTRLFNKKPITPSGKFKEQKDELLRRANLVVNGLAPLGLSSALLNTEELIDLLYSTYNPDLARRQKLFNISTVDADVITKMAAEKKE
jgi:type IV secretory pathway VirB4 component